MAYLVHRTPSVGGLTKKILTINPDLGTASIIAIIRECTGRQGSSDDEFGPAETIDEERALELAKASLRNRTTCGVKSSPTP